MDSSSLEGTNQSGFYLTEVNIDMNDDTIGSNDYIDDKKSPFETL